MDTHWSNLGLQVLPAFAHNLKRAAAAGVISRPPLSLSPRRFGTRFCVLFHSYLLDFNTSLLSPSNSDVAKHIFKVKAQAKGAINKSEYVWWRMLWSTPLLVVFAVAVLFMGPQHYPAVTPVEVAARTGRLEDAGGVPVKMNYTGVKGHTRLYLPALLWGNLQPVVGMGKPDTISWTLSQI